ncbi:TolC family protein [Mucilaginibacter limnophilus]|uniref:TolC family protein n=1 Tax=Mucilaginibacter limnophilus TaxID=1932778 RepID=A0A3S2VKM5_9SPHI|nr:TolC family protein [Mucilaginibacter limnophilus]RVT98205.1 TolC family protein [Mucilaginibacter limnophilus]
MKIKIIKAVTCLILFTVPAISVVAQQKISLLKAVELALERNLTIKQAQFNEALSTEDLKQSKYNRLPDLGINSQGSFNFGRSLDQSTYSFTNERIFTAYGSLTSQVVLFQGGQLRNQIIQNKITLEADKTNTAKVKNDLILNVITTYLSVLNNQDLLTASRQQTEIARQTLNRSEISFKAGNQTTADLSQARAQLSTADLNVTDAQNALDQSILTLKQYLEIPPETVIEVEKPDISKISVKTLFNAQDVYNTAVSVNPDVRLAELRRDALAQAVKVAQGAYYPTLAMFASLGSNYSSIYQRVTGVDPITQQPIFFKPSVFGQLNDNFYQSIGVSLQIPIFTRFATRTSVRKAKINLQNAEVTAQLARNNLSKIIYQAVWDVQAADKRYQSAIQTYNSNKVAYNAILERFNVGLVNSLDLNTALTNLNKAQFDMIQAQYQLVFRSKVIDYYLGNPITL